MLAYLFKRLVQLIPTLFGISLLSFFLMQLAPGGPIDQMADLNPRVTPEVKARIRHDLGLDKSIPVQYVTWLKHIAFLDFGISYNDHRPVAKKILERLPATLLLNVLAIGFMILLAIPIGFFSAIRANTLLDKLMTVFVFIGFSLPTYALALALMILFGLKLGWLPVSGLASIHFVPVPWYARVWDSAKHLILPTVVFCVKELAGRSRDIRPSKLVVIKK